MSSAVGFMAICIHTGRVSYFEYANAVFWDS